MIAYANVIENVEALYGVYAKVMDQHRACRQAGIPLDFHVFSYNPSRFVPEGMHFHVLPQRAGKASKLYFQAREIARTLSAYDVVVLRSLAWTPMYVLGMRQKAFRLITEHHTKQLGELLSGGRLVTWMVYAACKKGCLELSDGVLGMTGEIVQDVLHGTGGQKPARAIPNGVEVESISRTGCASFDGTELRLAFVASGLHPWHGLDRVVAGLNAYQGDTPIVLHLVGDMRADQVPLANTRVKPCFHGVLQRSQMDGVLADMHLGISSMAVFRNRMRQACVLKSREYMARGLPFVYAYDDPDIDEDFPYCKKFPALEAGLETSSLMEFARFIATRKQSSDVSGIMRAYALARMDWKPKMRALYDFAKQARQEPGA